MIKTFYCSDHHFATAVSSNAENSSSSQERDYHISQGSSPSKNQIFYHTLTMNDCGDKNLSEFTDGKDDGHESDTLRTEDLESRMDLTDDLLHMVCSA
jgi:hypothetical protein